MEIACFEDSVLSQQVEDRFGKGSAIRCGLFNGCDLEDPKGVELIKRMIRQHRPVHVWISCNCGPFCPLQHLNRRTQAQSEQLDRKQAQARVQYKGAQEAARFAHRLGSQIHWELSERSEAWKLPEVEAFVTEMGMKKVTCHGCTVGLRTSDGKKALCKGWTVATCNEALLQHLNLKCQRNHAHGECRGRNAVQSSRYTKVFARKVIDCLQEQEVWSRIVQEVQRPHQETSGENSHDEPCRTTSCRNCHDKPRREIPSCQVSFMEEQNIQQSHSQQAFANEEAGDEESPEAAADGPEDPEQRKRRQEILRKIQHLHRVTGHGDIPSLIKALQARGVPEEVIEVARRFSCPTCQERKRPGPRRQAHLETLPRKWERLQVDLADWEHPVSKRKMRIAVFIDEGSRFRAAKVFPGPYRRAGNWEDLRRAYEEIWLPAHGVPASIRVDSAGAWVSEKADTYFSERGVYLETIPAEAHWQIGIVERAIQSMKAVLDSLAQEFPEMSEEELVGRAVWIGNARDLYRGFSPLQHAAGRTPDEDMRMFESTEEKPLNNDVLEDGGFGQNIRAMCLAEKTFIDEQARQRVQRAQAMGHRKSQYFVPGDLVFYWRKQQAGKQHANFPKGRFLGPARILATESRKDSEGVLRPGSVIWLHRAGRLLRAAPEQLRRASPREELVESLKGPVELPWTITSLAKDPKKRTYFDITNEVPDEDEWMNGMEEPVPEEHEEAKFPHITSPETLPKQRVVGKRSPDSPHEGTRTKSQRFPSSRGTKRPGEEHEDPQPRTLPLRGVGSRESHPEGEGETEEEAMDAVEIEIDLPTSKRGLQKFLANPVAYICQKLKRKQVEVNERRLSPEEKQEFLHAKDKEVRNFVAAECFRAWNGRELNEAEIMGMRWLLTWKYDEKYINKGGRKAKARAVVLGFQDPKYSSREASAPTPTKAGRQLFLQYCSWRKFRLQKGDVSGAFLQGDDLQEEMWCRPLPEICKQLGVEDGTPMLMKKAAYGLVQAPLHWYRSVCSFLSSLGYVRLKTEPCCWIYKDTNGVVRSLIHGHVDDFLFAGDKECEIHKNLMDQIKKKFSWGTWESDDFIQCGVRIRQHADGSMDLDQEKSITELEEIHISRDRARQGEAETTLHEKSALRALLGSLSWICGQTMFLYSVDVNFLITKVPVSQVDDILKANQLVRAFKKWQHYRMKIHTFPSDEELELSCWSDAAWANRPNGRDSTEGIFIGMSTKALRQGHEADVSPVYWRSGKVERVCRSPAAAETMAAIDGEDDLSYLRILWGELCGHVLDPLRQDECARQTKGHLITDAKNLFDKLNNPVLTVKGCEKRSSIEALGLRENMEKSNVTISWVHGDAMIANSLTKTTEKHQMQLFIQMGFRWKVVYDEFMMSAKARKRQGLDALAGAAAAGQTYNTITHQPLQPYDQHTSHSPHQV